MTAHRRNRGAASRCYPWLLGVLLSVFLGGFPRPLPAAESELAWAIFLEQRAVILSSPWVTIGGIGGGIGIEVVWRNHYAAELSADVLFSMGNAVSTQLAIGLQDDGFWQPGFRATGSLLVGDRIEVLRDDGSRPPRPNWALGGRVMPLRFAGKTAFASALEVGAGSDMAGGLFFELTVLKAGAQW